MYIINDNNQPLFWDGKSTTVGRIRFRESTKEQLQIMYVTHIKRLESQVRDYERILAFYANQKDGKRANDILNKYK